MKKAKISLGLMAGLLSVVALAGCDSKPLSFKTDDSILTYKLADGSEVSYSAKDIWNNYYADSSVNQTMFDAIYKLIVQNYFKSVDPANAKFGLPQMESEILPKANKALESDKTAAKKEADGGDISYDDAFQAKCDAKGCEDEEELLQHYIYQYQEELFKEDFYDVYGEEIANGDGTFKNILRDGVAESDQYPVAYKGYIEKKAPYHLSHILVKIEDSGAANYWNGTISEDNADTLYQITKQLANGEDFGTVAKLYKTKGDESSAENYGELGIVDKDTIVNEYVKEFLALYVYENIYSQDKATVANSNIAMSSSVIADYKAKVGEDIGTIDYSAFKTIYDVRKITKGYKDVYTVNDGDATYFPRNIYYNDLLNKHQLSLIKYDGEVAIDDENNTTGWRKFPFMNGTNNDENHYLAAKNNDGEWTPILVTRAGASSYQGIHFILMNRTPFEASDVALSSYYTTKYPGQSAYPKTAEGVDANTYVNYLSNKFNTADVRSRQSDRAEAVKSKIENFDSSYLNMFIYQTNVKKGNLKFTADGQAIADKINAWIDVQKTKAEYDEYNSWNETWDAYLDILDKQQEQRERLLPYACAIGYQYNPEGERWDSELGLKVIAALKKKYGEDNVEYKKEVIKEGEGEDQVKSIACYLTLTINGVSTNYNNVNELYEKFGGLCNNAKIK